MDDNHDDEDDKRTHKKGTCSPSARALCQADYRSKREGLVLPSANYYEGEDGAVDNSNNNNNNNGPLFKVTADPSQLFNPVLKLLAQVDACGKDNKGHGRIYSESLEYTVIACDAIQGNHVLVYDKTKEGGEISIVEQTFGPMAYLLILILSTINIYALATASSSGSYKNMESNSEQKEILPALKINTDQPQTDSSLLHSNKKTVETSGYYTQRIFQWNAIISVLACFIVYWRQIFQFYTQEDQSFFWVSGVCSMVYLMCGVEKAPEGYIWALSVMASTLYRTHETPYAPIIAYILGYRTWSKMLVLCNGGGSSKKIASGKLTEYADLFICLLYTAIFCEIALKPQCLYQEIWPIYYMFHTFICYCIVKYQDVSLRLWTKRTDLFHPCSPPTICHGLLKVIPPTSMPQSLDIIIYMALILWIEVIQ